MHALAWMHHLHLGGSPDANEMLLTGNLVNLGGFNSLRHRSVAGFKAVPSVGLSFELTDPVRSFGPVRGYLPPIDYPYDGDSNMTPVTSTLRPGNPSRKGQD